MMKTKLSRLLAVMLASVLVVTVCSIPALGEEADGVTNKIMFHDAQEGQSVVGVLRLENKEDVAITIKGATYTFTYQAACLPTTGWGQSRDLKD